MISKTKLKSYIFRVEIEQEEDGRWSAEIPLLPGCATWDIQEKKPFKP